MHNIIETNKAVARMPEFRLKEPADVVIPADTPLAIVGLNASGKTLLVDMLTGAHPLLGNEIKYDFSPSASNKASQNISRCLREYRGRLLPIALESRASRRFRNSQRHSENGFFLRYVV